MRIHRSSEITLDVRTRAAESQSDRCVAIADVVIEGERADRL